MIDLKLAGREQRPCRQKATIELERVCPVAWEGISRRWSYKGRIFGLQTTGTVHGGGPCRFRRFSGPGRRPGQGMPLQVKAQMATGARHEIARAPNKRQSI